MARRCALPRPSRLGVSHRPPAASAPDLGGASACARRSRTAQPTAPAATARRDASAATPAGNSPAARHGLALDGKAEAAEDVEGARQMKGVGDDDEAAPAALADDTAGVDRVLEGVARSRPRQRCARRRRRAPSASSRITCASAGGGPTMPPETSRWPAPRRDEDGDAVLQPSHAAPGRARPAPPSPRPEPTTASVIAGGCRRSGFHAQYERGRPSTCSAR